MGNANELFLNIEKDKIMHENKMCLDKIQNLQSEKKQMMETSHKERQNLMAELKQKYNEKERALTDSINDLMAKNVQLNEERTQIENELNVKIKELDLASTRCSELAQRKESDLKQ